MLHGIYEKSPLSLVIKDGYEYRLHGYVAMNIEYRCLTLLQFSATFPSKDSEFCFTNPSAVLVTLCHHVRRCS